MVNSIVDKVLLITGGTGSFGNAVLNRFLHTDHFKEIRIFSRDEKKQDDMRNQLKNDKLKFYIGDVGIMLVSSVLCEAWIMCFMLLH
jgi:UDP-N-acetylglucosamine 4,6-dehydratase